MLEARCVRVDGSTSSLNDVPIAGDGYWVSGLRHPVVCIMVAASVTLLPVMPVNGMSGLFCQLRCGWPAGWWPRVFFAAVHVSAAGCLVDGGMRVSALELLDITGGFPNGCLRQA